MKKLQSNPDYLWRYNAEEERWYTYAELKSRRNDYTYGNQIEREEIIPENGEYKHEKDESDIWHFWVDNKELIDDKEHDEADKPEDEILDLDEIFGTKGDREQEEKDLAAMIEANSDAESSSEEEKVKEQ